jgi:hypothetical protein
VLVAGHIGPHPKEYHEVVMEQIKRATSGKLGDEYKKALQDELIDLAADISTPGTRLNKLVTRTP